MFMISQAKFTFPGDWLIDPRMSRKNLFILRDRDVEADGMANTIERTGGALQIIILDHASESVWKNTPLIHPVADWRDEEHALNPLDWIRDN